EDADVILHEYGHAIMNSAAPGTNNGTERQALDEANGDYFAASYSRLLSPNSWDLVYTWDGHNEYWGGRMASSDKHYPEDLANNLYTDTDIWSSTIMQIWEDLGRDVTDQLLIESAYSYASGMTMPGAAALFYQADVDLNAGINFWSICNRFQARGLMGMCPNSINEHTISLNSKLVNSQSFAEGTGDAVIQLNRLEKVTMTIYRVNGQLIRSTTHNSSELSISPAQFKSGLYLIEIAGESGSETFKLVRY
ncbi:MAG: T9SS type A sorting domain-containing protein, partial [Flavobacteriales bacterium]|nr:T9SS type A sorting domain-containing protein [Flavobacteriales bacterium]